MISPSIIFTAMPHGYNASIAEIRNEGEKPRRLLSYRYHPKKGEWRTQIMIQDGGENWVRDMRLELPLQYGEMSHEDGRFFWHRDKIHMSLTVAIFPGVTSVPPPCITIYGRLENRETKWELVDVVQPKFGNNDWSGQNKNNVFFEHGGRIYQVYQCSPEQVIVRVNEDGSVDEVFRTKSPSWEHGEIRGGTQPLNFLGGTRWLRFFHSLHKHGNNRSDWTYSIGALVMQKEHPFQIERISKFPVFSGDERFVAHCSHWKQGCALPYGAIPDGDGWIISIGVNDCMCGLLKVSEKDLNL